jgi:hypothetical protein
MSYNDYHIFIFTVVAGAINKFFYGVRAMAAAGSIASVMG